MRHWLQRNADFLFNAFLFLCFLDIGIHQVAMKVLALDTSVVRWYWGSLRVMLQNQLSSGFALVSPTAAGASILWYDVYGHSCWLWQADWTRMSFTEWAFAGQMLVMNVLILIRRPHRFLDGSLLHQLVAIVAFGSGIFFLGEAATPQAWLRGLSMAILIAAAFLGLAALLNLGRSFGILIALRTVETRGLYRFVRHPMYGADILMRIGFLVSHPTPAMAGLFLVSTACYVYRAILEERFLVQQPEYQDYMRAVPYRFVPRLF